MIKRISIATILFIIVSCSNEVKQCRPYIKQVRKYELKNCTVRAMDVNGKGDLYFAGSNGKWGWVKDGQISVDSIRIDSIIPEFRSIAFRDANTLFLVSVTNPAALIEVDLSTKNWEILYEDTSRSAFFDMVDFNSNGDGFLLGDPQENCFNLAISLHDNSSWDKVECMAIPNALENEAPFAASNTNVEYVGDHIWYVTGGKNKSRVYHSSNKGIDWEVINTPIVSGRTMTGIYSIDFYDEHRGVVAGGNWDSVKERTINIAFTENGGANWIKKEIELPYISCVQYVPNSDANELILLSGRARGGDSKMFYYNAQLDSCYEYENNNFLSIKFADDTTFWLSGKNSLASYRIR